MAVTKKSAVKSAAKAPAKKVVAAPKKAAAPTKKVVKAPVAKPAAKPAPKAVAKAPVKVAAKAPAKVVTKTIAKAAPKAAPVKKATAVIHKEAPSVKEVLFSVYSPDSKSVDIAGEFNNWDPSKGKMKKDKEGNWFLKVKLSRGAYQYKVVYDGTTWETDQKAPSVMAEHGQNSVINVE